MLVLTRKMAEVIKLGDNITVTVVRTSNGSVQLGIEAPRSIRIMRAECDEAMFFPVKSGSEEPLKLPVAEAKAG